MVSDCITYQNSGYFSKLINDYLNEKDTLHDLYNRFPTIENFNLQIEEKQRQFQLKNRIALKEQLQQQYQNFSISDITQLNINYLEKENTFTVTTGHQLNLFTGPIYFIYKIVSTIKLCKQLKEAYPDYNFVPVYWMATEDHDFEEINHFIFKGKKINWKKNSTGPVGRLSTDGLDEVFEEFSKVLPSSLAADNLQKLFTEAYLQHDNLAEATRFLVNELFKNYGLVIVDGDDKKLKELFIPYVKNEIIQQQSFEKINATSELLKDYSIQVTPREINLFYIESDLRERIVFEDNLYKVLHRQLQFTEAEILQEIENYPEKFSPNVVLRPLYQEVILPNLCYIGGGGELAYWLQLKSNFEENSIPFPMLLLRNSVIVATEKQNKKREKLALTWLDLFAKQSELISRKTAEFSELSLNFSSQKNFLQQQFKELYKIASQTDASYFGAVAAQEKKQLKGLENLEKKLLKAEKKKYAEQLARIASLQNELFPNGSLQERKLNFSEVALETNISDFIAQLYHDFDPLAQHFTIEILK